MIPQDTPATPKNIADEGLLLKLVASRLVVISDEERWPVLFFGLSDKMCLWVFSLPCQMSSTETRSWCGEQVERAHDQKDLSLNSCQGSDRRKNPGGGDAGYGREMPTGSE